MQQRNKDFKIEEPEDQPLEIKQPKQFWTKELIKKYN